MKIGDQQSESLPALRGAGRGVIQWSGSQSLSAVSRWLSPSLGDSSRVLLLGAPATGKSLLLRGLIAEQNRLGERVILVDPEYRGSTSGWYSCASIPELIDIVRAGHIAVVSRPSLIPRVYRMAWTAGDCIIAVDEAADCGAQRGAVDPALWTIFRRGRHKNISVLLASQRRTDVDPNFQGLAPSVLIGHMPGAADRNWSCNNWGIEPPADALRFRAWFSPSLTGVFTINI